MQVAGLFSGIGGFEVGLARAGHYAMLLCENDPAAKRVLQARLADVNLVADVRELRSIPRGCDMIVAGFPCQDLSQAGRAKGIFGERSGLVKHVFRLLERRRPQWVLLENVRFLLHVNSGHSLRWLLSRLEGFGYRWAYRVVDSRAFGLPQRRERLFILASLDGDPREVLLSDDAKPPEIGTDRRDVAAGFSWTEGNKGTGWAIDCVPALKGGSAFGIPSPPAVLMPDGRIVTPDITDAERLQGFDAGWTGAALEVKGRHRWRLVGNAVSVPAATWIGRRLIAAAPYDDSGDEPIDWEDSAPLAAWRLDGKAHSSAVSTWPKRWALPPLASFLRHPGYELSERAAAGFLARLEASTLNVPPRLLSGLRGHLASLRARRSRSIRHAA